MKHLKATNTFVWIIRDLTPSEKGGLLIPTSGKVKPHTGIIFSVGGKVTDPDIKRGKAAKALFHKGVGFEIDFEDKTYLVLQEHEILAVI